MKTIKIILFTALIVAGSLGCKKGFLDINKNPNNVTESSITPELILPNAMHGVGVQTALGYGFLNNWIGYWSPSGSYSPSTEESTYNITTTFGDAKFNAINNVLFDLDNVEKRSAAANKPYYRAIGMVLKAHLFQNLVDIYGNVPYTQAFDPAIASPAYDKAEDIYANLQVKLDTAVSLFLKNPVPLDAKTIDIIYGGNATLWVKFANTLKLRLLIRQSKVNASPTAELAKISTNGGVLMSGETVDVNPSYINDVNKQSPFYGTYGKQPSGVDANEYYRANNYILGILKDNGDTRIGRFFAPAASPTSPSNVYVGTTYGAPPDDAVNGTHTSNIGPGLAGSATQAQWILTSVESMFLYAEAVARGWLAGDAKTAYENAVKESFIWLGVPSAGTAADTYLTTAVIGKWANRGSTPDSVIAFITTQKYIALTGINPLEAWSDYRRLGTQPKSGATSVNPARISAVLPVRLLYPSSEIAVNGANVPKSINQFTSTIFWDK
ncbi:MAG: SusD/RagB family nutrient-binding outer membrane lipoprotein [Ferruginibacter sp.]|nr:SusD/RagB family nutrient-binding outer membrane lipoprotein [Ferruginibacter sp.]